MHVDYYPDDYYQEGYPEMLRASPFCLSLSESSLPHSILALDKINSYPPPPPLVMSKKYSLQSSGPALSQHAHRLRKSLDSSSFLSRAAQRPKDQYSQNPRRKSLDDRSFRKEAPNNHPHGMYDGADLADEIQLAKQKAAAWVWHQRHVGEVVAPTKRSAITSLHQTPPPPSFSPRESATDSAADGPVKSRFCSEALKKQQQEHKTKQEVQAEDHLHVNSTPPAPANSNKEARPTSLYDAFELSSLKDQMSQLVQKIQKAQSKQKPAESEEPAVISSKRMMRNKNLDSGLAGLPNSPHSDLSSNRMMRNMKLDSEPMDSFHSDPRHRATGLMNVNDQHRVDGDNKQRPGAGDSVRLSTDNNGGKILHQGKGNLRKPFSAIHKLFVKISKAVKGSSKGTVSHEDNKPEESAFDHAGDQGHLHTAQHNYQHYHHHHHHHHYHHHNFIHVDGDHHQSEQDVNASTEGVVQFRRRRLSDSYVEVDEMNIRQRGANNVMAMMDESDVELGTALSPMRRRRHSASEGLFSDHNSPNHPVPLYAKKSGSPISTNNGRITGLGYYSPRLGRPKWAYSEEDGQTTANIAAAAISPNYVSLQASRFANSQTHSKLEEREEDLSAPRQRRFSESFADYQAPVRLRNYAAAALSPIQMKYRSATLLDKSRESLFSDYNLRNYPVPVNANKSDSSPSLPKNDEITGQGYYPAGLGRSVWACSEEEDDDQTATIAAAATSPNYLSSQASRFANSQTHSKVEDREEALSARQRRFSESFADRQANHVRLNNHAAVALSPIQMKYRTAGLLDRSAS